MSGYISLNELPRTLEEGQEQGRTIAWQFEGGTSFDTTATELNLSRTEGAIRAFGFGGLIVRSFLGEQTSYGSGEMDVVGTNADGSAVGAAGGKVTRVDTVSSSLEDDLLLYGNCRWPTATIEINRNELAFRIADNIKKGADRRETQTQELDWALRVGVMKAALRKNKQDFLDFRGGFEPVGFAGFTFTEVSTIVGHAPLIFGITAGLTHGISALAAAIHNKSRGSPALAGKRLSIFPGVFQPDRFIGGTILTAARFIRYNDEKSQPPIEW